MMTDDGYRRGNAPVMAKHASYATTWHRLRAKFAGQKPSLQLGQPVLHSALDNFAQREITYDLPTVCIRKQPVRG